MVELPSLAWLFLFLLRVVSWESLAGLDLDWKKDQVYFLAVRYRLKSVVFE